MTIDLDAPLRLGPIPHDGARGASPDGEIAVSLLGGPLHRLGKRAGLVRGESTDLLEKFVGRLLGA